MPKVRFLTDENVSPRLVQAIRNKGFDVEDIKEKSLFGISDNQILMLARKEKRVIITYDSDFANLLNYPGLSHHGVILLRYTDLKPQEIVRRFLMLLDFLARRKLLTNLTIASDDFIEIIEK